LEFLIQQVWAGFLWSVFLVKISGGEDVTVFGPAKDLDCETQGRFIHEKGGVTWKT
jgi:hypothetical protein